MIWSSKVNYSDVCRSTARCLIAGLLHPGNNVENPNLTDRVWQACTLTHVPQLFSEVQVFPQLSMERLEDVCAHRAYTPKLPELGSELPGWLLRANRD